MKRVNKGAKRRFLLLFSIFILLTGYVSYSTFNYWDQILNNKKETSVLENKYKELLDNKEILENDVIKLQDPEYKARYARENQMYTKDGETILIIIDKDGKRMITTEEE